MLRKRTAGIQPINTWNGLPGYAVEDVTHNIELINTAAKPIRVGLARRPSHSPPVLGRLYIVG